MSDSEEYSEEEYNNNTLDYNQFGTILNNMKKPELVDLARRFNLHYTIHNIQKLKREQLVLELLGHIDEVIKIYLEDKPQAEIRKDLGLPEKKPRRAKDQQKLRKEQADIRAKIDEKSAEALLPENLENIGVKKRLTSEIIKLSNRYEALERLKEELPEEKVARIVTKYNKLNKNLINLEKKINKASIKVDKARNETIKKMYIGDLKELVTKYNKGQKLLNKFVKLHHTELDINIDDLDDLPPLSIG
jgi:hypothetical protein